MVPFPQFQLQSRLAARVLSGAATLPSRREMRAAAAAFHEGLREAGVPPRWTHMMGDLQWCAGCGKGRGAEGARARGADVLGALLRRICLSQLAVWRSGRRGA